MQFAIHLLCSPSLTHMSASNISGMPAQLRRNPKHFQTDDSSWNGTLACTLLNNAELKFMLSNVLLGGKFLSLHQRETPDQPMLAMLFSAKEIKPNILKGQFVKLRNADTAKMSLRPCGDGHISHIQENPKPLPPPPTPCDGYFDLNTFSSEGCSFSTNPNDVYSLTSSDWGDEACEIDRRRSQHVKELFSAIDQVLYEPGCLKNYVQPTHIRSSPELQSGFCESSNHLTSSDLASVKNLIPECEEWVTRFPHFRLHGVQIRPLSVNSREQSQQWQAATTHHSRLSDPCPDALPPTTRRLIRLPETNRVSQTPPGLQNAPSLCLPGAPLIIQGQRLQTPPSVNTTTWLNRSHVSRAVSRTQVGAASACLHYSNNSKTLLSTLPENPFANALQEVVTRESNKSKKSPYFIRQWGGQTVKAAETQVMMRSSQCAKSRDGLTRKKTLTQALVVIILNEAFAVLATRTPVLVEKLQDSPAVAAKLANCHSTLNSRELQCGRGARMVLSPDSVPSTKAQSPSRLQERKSSECPMNFVLSGKSFTSTTSTTFSLSTSKSNAKFSITWPTRLETKISPKPPLNSTRTSPTLSGRSNAPGGRNKLQTGSTLPPITINGTNPQVMPRQFKRSGKGTPRLPSIFPTAAKHPSKGDDGTNYHSSAKVLLHGVSNQAAVLEHLSRLRGLLNNERLSRQETHVRRNHSCVTKFAPCPSKTTQIQFSVKISAHKHQPADSVYCKLTTSRNSTE